MNVELNTILTASGLLVTIAFGYFQWWLNRKRFSFGVLSNNLLSSADEEIQDEVEIRYKNVRVKDVRLIVIRMTNDGSVPIRKEDFEQAIEVSFPRATILSVELADKSPRNLKIPFTSGMDWFEVAPALFNAGDYVDFKILISSYEENLEVDTRILNVPKITILEHEADNRSIFMSMFALLVTVGSFGFCLGFAYYLNVLYDPSLLKSFVPLVISLILVNLFLGWWLGTHKALQNRLKRKVKSTLETKLGVSSLSSGTVSNTWTSSPTRPGAYQGQRDGP